MYHNIYLLKEFTKKNLHNFTFISTFMYFLPESVQNIFFSFQLNAFLIHYAWISIRQSCIPNLIQISSAYKFDSDLISMKDNPK